ncbi:MAG: hypothetical protein PUK59_04875 [Actinomycetaceae bacterium]|nr:hypothetical protein [Actinomycetaceae bacterium]
MGDNIRLADTVKLHEKRRYHHLPNKTQRRHSSKNIAVPKSVERHGDVQK